AIKAIRELAAEAGKPRWDWQLEEGDKALADAVKSACGSAINEAYQVADKQQRQDKLAAIRERVMEELAGGEAPKFDAGAVSEAIHDLEYVTVRERILSGEPRIDGRDTRTVRPITIRTGVLPRTHGSALFTRGETQAI